MSMKKVAVNLYNRRLIVPLKEREELRKITAVHIATDDNHEIYIGTADENLGQMMAMRRC